MYLNPKILAFMDFYFLALIFFGILALKIPKERAMYIKNF